MRTVKIGSDLRLGAGVGCGGGGVKVNPVTHLKLKCNVTKENLYYYTF